jgi:hypothetical protein
LIQIQAFVSLITMLNLNETPEIADKHSVGCARFRIFRHIQNENGSILIFVIITFFIAMMLMAASLQNESMSIQQQAALTRMQEEKNDFANYIYTAFSSSPLGICDNTLNVSTSNTNPGIFQIANLQDGSSYPDSGVAGVGPSYLQVCSAGVGPCTGPGMTYSGGVSVGGSTYQANFQITYQYFSPGMNMATTNTIGFTLQYTVGPATGPGFSVSNCVIIDTSAAACSGVGLTYCPTAARCPLCEASGGCWQPGTPGSCVMGPPACPLPTPGVGGC